MPGHSTGGGTPISRGRLRSDAAKFPASLAFLLPPTGTATAAVAPTRDTMAADGRAARAYNFELVFVFSTCLRACVAQEYTTLLATRSSRWGRERGRQPRRRGVDLAAAVSLIRGDSLTCTRQSCYSQLCPQEWRPAYAIAAATAADYSSCWPVAQREPCLALTIGLYEFPINAGAG